MPVESFTVSLCNKFETSVYVSLKKLKDVPVGFTFTQMKRGVLFLDMKESERFKGRGEFLNGNVRSKSFSLQPECLGYLF